MKFGINYFTAYFTAYFITTLLITVVCDVLFMEKEMCYGHTVVVYGFVLTIFIMVLYSIHVISTENNYIYLQDMLFLYAVFNIVWGVFSIDFVSRFELYRNVLAWLFIVKPTISFMMYAMCFEYIKRQKHSI